MAPEGRVLVDEAAQVAARGGRSANASAIRREAAHTSEQRCNQHDLQLLDEKARVNAENNHLQAEKGEVDGSELTKA